MKYPEIKIHVGLVGVLLGASLFTGCIHEYPFATQVPATPSGNDPTAVSTYIEVDYDLQWENILHHIDFSTRSDDQTPHRFMVEVRENGESVVSDIHYLSDSEFSSGHLRRRLSAILANKVYEIAVWYDMRSSSGDFSYEGKDLRTITLLDYSSTDVETRRCGMAYDFLDLRDIKAPEENRNGETLTYTKTLNLQHPGARFEIVATDVQQFIADHKEDLNQGDSFSVEVSLSKGAYDAFNVFTSTPLRTLEALNLSGHMRLPFAEYESLKIAEGFFFCHEEEEVTARITIINSSLVAISQTDYFTFPARRGFITTIEGDFLTHPLDGIFQVNSLWDGEIEFFLP
ncbi:MAG: hypothetical protein J1D77_09305 [Muribaculaceae bacterium]|nr:hypothetical protein [Muribaculaceae bacterium]